VDTCTLHLFLVKKNTVYIVSRYIFFTRNKCLWFCWVTLMSWKLTFMYFSRHFQDISWQFSGQFLIIFFKYSLNIC
jgi:hypothetical protein